MGTTGIIGIAGKCAKRLYSHNAGWSYVIKSISGGEFVDNPADIHNYDTIVINEGLNYKENKWNFVGGVSDYTHKILQELVGYQGELVSYNEKVDLNFLVNKRKDFFYFQKDVDEDNKQYFSEVKLLRTDGNTKLILGDSHSVSIYKPGWGISRNDGKTLNGFLNSPSKFYNESNLTDLTLYFGNIDVRFHIHRFGGIDALNKLLITYTNFAAHMIQRDVNITIQELIPIEDENRKLPGTGLYRGEPFFGTREERQSYVDYFNAEIRRLAPLFGYRVSSWDLPIDGFEASTKYKCMESKQSVHIRPDYYLNKSKFIK